MKRITVMVGLPASGKSKFLEFVDSPEFGDTVYVYSTDDQLEKIAKGLDITYDQVFNTHFKEAKKKADDLLDLAFQMGVDVYWDQTNMSKNIRKKIFSKKPSDYKVDCICFIPPENKGEWDIIKTRLASREGKTIPNSVMFNMLTNFESPTFDEGFESITFLDIHGNIIERIVK